MTKVFLVHAGPTPWDAENRLVGAHSLPLTPQAAGAVQQWIDGLSEKVTAVYACLANEACHVVARMIGKHFSLRPRSRPELEEVHLGLWRGLTREELEHRFGKVFALWMEQPLSVEPPEGESLVQAIERIGPALFKLLGRNDGGVVALPLRPLSLQIVAGLLRGENPEQIGNHLHWPPATETIDFGVKAPDAHPGP